MRVIECVPNFSEGRNPRIIEAISDTIRAVEGVTLLDVDPGKSTNRTVYTFVGEPEHVCEAAFQAIARAAALIDMRKHTGAHPRMGATDVCPFVPVAGVTMTECVELARLLGLRVGKELGIPVYLYAEAAQSEGRRSLADVRQGEYEGLAERMKHGFAPDFGPHDFNPASGATVIGARPFLIAYNVNLNTRSAKLANEIALNIREAGRGKRDSQGNLVRDEHGALLKVPGTLPACRAVGWYVDEYQRAQVSINLVDYRQTSLHQAFDEVCRQAAILGLRVTGSEIVGLVPLAPLLDAGRHYLAKQGRPTGAGEAELVRTAILSLGLADVAPFDPNKKIVEYSISPEEKLLVSKTVKDFVDELASDSPAPGGGSVAALCGALASALSAMVACLTHGKKGFESVKPLMDKTAGQSQELKARFLRAVDQDTMAFNKIAEARRLPKDTPENARLRDQAIEAANREATLVPLGVLQAAVQAGELAVTVVEHGNPNTLSDAGVAGLTAHAAAEGAYYNVLINLSAIEDKGFQSQIHDQATTAIARMRELAGGISTRVLSRLATPGN